MRLLHSTGAWPAGTTGAVVAEQADFALIEVVTDAHTDEHGLPERDLFDDLLAVPYGALEVVERAPTTTH